MVCVIPNRFEDWFPMTLSEVEPVLYAFIDLMCGAVFALPLAWLFMAYCKNGSRNRFLLISLFTLYLCEMFDVVGIPAIQYIRWEPAVNLIPFGDEKDSRFFLQIGLNALMFVPLGFLLPILWSRCRRWYSTLLAGFLTSLTIEVSQLFSFRATDVDDLIMNTLGAFLGYCLCRACFRKRWAGEEQADSGRVSQWCSLTVSILIPLVVIVFLRSLLQKRIYSLL